MQFWKKQTDIGRFSIQLGLGLGLGPYQVDCGLYFLVFSNLSTTQSTFTLQFTFIGVQYLAKDTLIWTGGVENPTTDLLISGLPHGPQPPPTNWFVNDLRSRSLLQLAHLFSHQCRNSICTFSPVHPMKLLPSLIAVKGVPSSSCKRITFRATSFPFTLETKQKDNHKYGKLMTFFLFLFFWSGHEKNGIY